MDSLFDVGNEYMSELASNREAEKRKSERRQKAGGLESAGKSRKTKGLRETDPWK